MRVRARGKWLRMRRGIPGPVLREVHSVFDALPKDVRRLFCDGLYRQWPDRLAELLQTRPLSPEELGDLLPLLWMYKIEGTDQALSLDAWRTAFLDARFQFPARTWRYGRALRLFRGAAAANRDGLSWTPIYGCAEHFAQTRQGPRRAPGQVWVATVPRSRIILDLSRCHDLEREYVVDARGLHIRAAHLRAQRT